MSLSSQPALRLSAVWRNQVLSVGLPRPASVNHQAMVMNYLFARMARAGISPTGSGVHTEDDRIVYTFQFSAAQSDDAHRFAVKMTGRLGSKGRPVSIRSLRKASLPVSQMR